MKVARILGLVALICISIQSKAQTVVKGQILLSDSTFLSGNLLILDTKDSSLITGQYISKTNFEIQSDQNPFLLKIRMIGYEDRMFQVKESIDLGQIKMNAQNLEEIEISAQKLPFQNSNGNPKINLKNTVFSNAASFQELIQKMPGVEIQGEEVQIIGRGNAKIFIDGVETSFMAANSLSPTQIESIEIIKNPGASIDADGMAIIKIKLNKQIKNGVTGSIMTHYTKAFYHLGYVDFSAQFKAGKWSFNLGGNTNFGQTGVTRKSENYLNRDSVDLHISSLYRERTSLNGISNWVGGIQYNFNPNHSVGIQYNGNYSNYKLDVDTDLENNYPDSLSTIQAKAIGRSISSSHRASFNYNGVLDSLASTVFLGFNFNHLPSSYADTVSERISSEGIDDWMNTLANGENTVNLYTGQFDYQKNFAKGHSIKIGAKYNYSNLNSDLIVASTENLQQQNRYGEHVGGIYIQGGLKFEKVQLNIGFRTEFTGSKAIEEIENNKFLDTNYFSYFPYLDLTFPTKKWTFTTKFSSNIERPSFEEMTPYVYYVNSMFGVVGNPYIRPGMVYGAEQQFIANETGTSINVGYRYTQNPASTIPLAQENGIAETVYQYTNLKKKENIYLELNQNLSFNNLYLYLSSTVSFEKFSDDEIILNHTINFPKFYLYGYFKYSIPKWFNVEVFGSLTTAYSDGIVEYNTEGDIGISISRSFFKDQFLVQITGNDLFQTAKKRANIAVNNDRYNALVTLDTRFFRLALTYRFGKLKESKYRHQSIDDDIKNRAN